MRHVFILNPAAGKKQSALALIPDIEETCRRLNVDYTVHVTDGPGHATTLARQEADKGDAVRLYACGGDGTLLEVFSGMAHADNAELGCIPCGSGNDFVRTLPHPENHRNIAAQVLGTAHRLDSVRCNGIPSLNLCSMGVDADVAMRMVKYKHLPLVSGSMAYNLALVDTFLRPLGQKLRIVMDTVDGPVEREGQYMFALAANGQYYGGGYHGSPLSQADDGLLDFVLIEKVSHLKMLTILGKYKRGEHLDLPICETFRGTSMTVYADKPAVVTADGECFTTPEVTFTLKPASLSFVYPASTEMLNNYEMCGKCAVTP